MIDIAIIVLGYHNVYELKNGLIESIRKQFTEYASNLSYRIVYIDNYSCDGSVKYIKAHRYDIDVLMCIKNFFYEESNNLGIQYSYIKYNPKYYLLLDADNMLKGGTIIKLVDYLEHHKDVGIVQPKVLRYDNTSIYSMGHYYSNEGKCRLIRNDNGEFDFENLPSCSILCTLFRKEVFIQCGLLNPVYDIYYESSDICFRARKHGFKIACCMDAIAYNNGTNTKNIENYHGTYYMVRNRLLFWYIHDRSRYEVFKLAAVERMQLLYRQIASAPLGINDSSLLAEHNAIVDALDIIKNRENITSNVSIKDYDKFKVIIF